MEISFLLVLSLAALLTALHLFSRLLTRRFGGVLTFFFCGALYLTLSSAGLL
ncbi:MAG: hypothetical protein ACLS6Q_08380 [Christensenellaceae bacterium]|jgi:hypothetical protein|nr:hypothetical protein [Christensenellaceae bacterium]